MNESEQNEMQDIKIEQRNLIFLINESERTASVFHGKSVRGDLVIPYSIIYKSNEYIIDSILCRAFEWSSIKSIQFPINSQVHSIEKEVFYNSIIESFTIPPSLVDLKEGWCSHVEKLININVHPNNPRYQTYDGKFIIGKSSIENEDFDVLVFCAHNIKIATIPYAFEGCSQLQEIEIPNDSKLQTIDNYSFSSSSIKKFIISPHLTKIGKGSFSHCGQIQQFEIPENSELKVIEANAFENSSIESLSIPSNFSEFNEGWCKCTQNLKRIRVSPKNSQYSCLDEKFIIGKSSIENEEYDVLVFSVRDIKVATIPSFIKCIGPYAFERCSQLQEIKILNDSKLQTIDNYSFSSSSIEKITVPHHLTRVGIGSFFGCEKLRKIKFPLNSQLRTIDTDAFRGSSLNEITFPPHLTEINNYAFYRCMNLRKIEFPANSKLKTIGKSAFFVTSIESFVVPSSVIKIETGAFSHCYKLFKFEIEENSKLQIIDEYAFAESQIKSISVPPSVTYIGKLIFYNCYELQIFEINENSSLKFINQNIFTGINVKIIMMPAKFNIKID